MLKIVSWNCNGALRKKISQISHLDADIYIIQECEDPSQTKDDAYKNWASNYLWHGSNKNKGIGVFAKNNISLEPLKIDAGNLESFLPFKVNNSINVVGIWTKEANSPTFKYIGQLWKYLQLHKDFFKEKQSIFIGDLNSNACWDVWDRWWNHSDVVKELEGIDIVSLYHQATKENHGAESSFTFYLHRKLERPYHIDYAFLSKSLAKSAGIEIGKFNDWIEFSDHMPISVTLK
jgi:exonuclease III